MKHLLSTAGEGSQEKQLEIARCLVSHFDFAGSIEAHLGEATAQVERTT